MPLIILIALCTIAAVELLLVLDWLKEIATRRKSAKFTRWLRIPWTALALFIAACIAYAYCIEPARYTTTRQTINTGKLPPDAKLTIAFLADLHLADDGPAFQHIMNALESHKPDLILLSGQNHNTEAGKQALQRLVDQTAAPLGIYALAGSAAGLESYLHGGKVGLLAGTARSFDIAGVYINIFGSESGEREKFARDLVATPKAAYTVVLHQSPDMLETAADAGANLYLCGHPDGLRVYLPLIGRLTSDTRPAARFGAGMHAHGDTLSYVSRGIGTPTGLLNRPRFQCPPEIAIIEIAGSRP